MRERRLTLRDRMEDRIAGQLIRLGYGVYARAALSRLTGQPMLAARGGLMDVTYQVFGKLGVPGEQTDAQRD